MERVARAKINLTLEVLGSAGVPGVPPGYHEVRSVLATLELADTLMFSRGEPGLRLTTDHPDLPGDRSNLIVRAAEAFFHAAGCSPDLSVHVVKRIPMGGGLGGGSADAAATLTALNELYGAGMSREELEEIGRNLGADVPFCVRGGTAFAAGIGDRLQSLPDLPPLWISLVIPPFAVETAWAYRTLDDWRRRHPRTAPTERASERMRAAIERGAWDELPLLCANDFQELVEARHPLLRRLREAALAGGALGVTMTGSGSTLVAWVENEAAGRRLAAALESRDRVTTILTRVHAPSAGEAVAGEDAACHTTR